MWYVIHFIFVSKHSHYSAKPHISLHPLDSLRKRGRPSQLDQIVDIGFSVAGEQNVRKNERWDGHSGWFEECQPSAALRWKRGYYPAPVRNHLPSPHYLSFSQTCRQFLSGALARKTFLIYTGLLSLTLLIYLFVLGDRYHYPPAGELFSSSTGAALFDLLSHNYNDFFERNFRHSRAGTMSTVQITPNSPVYLWLDAHSDKSPLNIFNVLGEFPLPDLRAR
jgi:hypothetical protein